MCICPDRFRDDAPHAQGCPEYVQRTFEDCSCWHHLRMGLHYDECPNYSAHDWDRHR